MHQPPGQVQNHGCGRLARMIPFADRPWDVCTSVTPKNSFLRERSWAGPGLPYGLRHSAISAGKQNPFRARVEGQRPGNGNRWSCCAIGETTAARKRQLNVEHADERFGIV